VRPSRRLRVRTPRLTRSFCTFPRDDTTRDDNRSLSVTSSGTRKRPRRLPIREHRGSKAGRRGNCRRRRGRGSAAGRTSRDFRSSRNSSPRSYRSSCNVRGRRRRDRDSRRRTARAACRPQRPPACPGCRRSRRDRCRRDGWSPSNSHIPHSCSDWPMCCVAGPECR
jgi:hypothetical protein